MSEKAYFIGAHAYSAPVMELGLYLVSTPIGNLADITIRALQVLAGVDILACEDTRVTRVLLDHYGIRRKLFLYHEHNAQKARLMLLAALAENKTVALVSDAGTPLVSDPGFKLVEEVRKAGHRIIPIPGASALLAAIVTTGLPTDSFLFAGFLSAKRLQRQKQLEQLKAVPATLVFYESPHRLLKTLQDMVTIFTVDRPAAICRELTKKFEIVDVSTLGNLVENYQKKDHVRGEIVVLVGEATDSLEKMGTDEINKILLELASVHPASKAAALAAKKTGHKKQELFRRLTLLKEREDAAKKT
ncbi:MULTISPECIES: 16S rRNA (cytidine(1402)-2'-O)-methyltransferase [unclassified Bartonella]|uniref:16S rRNA (cytidine(1402)-2'-O)-methyltransferase n=1 Tax=unclassified Bartonella TaxID=2645622 RepID=UPI00099ABEA6|nr:MULTISPECIES: 16S rRNA (cytidine(1402)-2'-O)-methyltransferase [unclassified Bartonella]AQX27552.1 16S rRNA (cytidine1402-2'-O)-methyltransferase [Bartonella sp. JB15]AQX28831.1 16S rRNA (cytidine1402-2'-O)-methyltransferase [Bartonella sp. JB63]